MKQFGKYLIVHDTSQPGFNKDILAWTNNFRDDLIAALKRISGQKPQIILSAELPHNQDQIPVIKFEEFSYCLIILTPNQIGTTNLPSQIDLVMKYCKAPGNPAKKKRVINILLDLAPAGSDQITRSGIRTLPLFYEKPVGIFNKTRPLDRNDPEYWIKITEIAEVISGKDYAGIQKNDFGKNLTIVYVCQSSPDLEIRRDILINELIKRGIQIIPEDRLLKKEDLENENMVDLLEYADLFIQMIGGEYDKSDQDSHISLAEKEYDLVSRFIRGEIKPSFSQSRPKKRLIWMPEQTTFFDNRQLKFADRIRTNVKYDEGKTEVFTGPYEQFKELLLGYLKTRIVHHVVKPEIIAENAVYLIHENSLSNEATEIANILRENSVNIVTAFDLAKRGNFIKAHREALMKCEGLIIYYGQKNLNWYTSLMLEIFKVDKSQRTQSFRFRAVISEGNLLKDLPRDDDFIYIKKENMTGLNTISLQLKKMLG